MQQYAKPTVTKLGSVAAKTEGGYNWVITELLTKRGTGGA